MGGFDAISAAETECLTAAEQVEREAGRVPNSSRIGRRTKIWILVSVSIVIVTVFVLLGIYVSEHGSVSSNWEEELQSCGFGRTDLDDDTSAVLQIFAPKEYNVSLHFDEELFRVDTLEPVFEGQVRVTVRVHQSVSCLVFHADNLTVDAIGVSEPDTSEVLICSDTKACQYELVLLHKQTGPGQSFEQNLYALHWRGHMFEKGSTYVISFLYRGVVSDKATALGLHRSKHGVCENSAEGNKNAECKEFIAVGSQLERNGARKVFPCLDSPFSKSVFHIRVEAPYDEAPVVLSNGKESHVFNSSDGASRVVVFESTPPMSTYLVAFVSGRFDVVSSRSIEEVQDSVYEVRGWSIRGRDLTTPAVVAGVKALEFYTDMLQIEQPQKAFDFVAFPGRKGAMENWGLLIFDELRLLDRNGSFWHYQMLSVVCHEVAHQWLGNMMTAKNWTQLFLNEGFAVTVEYYCMHHIDSRLSIDVFRFLGISPGGEKQHVHDGIVQNSLQCTDPLLCGPLVPKSDLDLDDSLVYSRGAITLYSLLNEAYLFSTLQDLLKKYSFSTLDITSVIEQHGKSNSNVGLGTLSSMNAMSNTVNSSTGTLAPLLFFPAGLFGVVSNKTGSNGTAIQVRVFCAWNDSHIKNKDIDTAVLEKLRTCEDVLGEMEHHHLDAVPRCGSEHGSTKEYHSSLTAVESNINLHSMTIQYQLDQVSEMIDMLLQDDNPCHFQDFRNKLIFLANLMLDHYEIALIEDIQALRVTLSVLDFIGATIQEFPRGLSEYLLLAPAYQILASLEDLARKSAYIDDDDECALKLQDIFYTLHPEYDADLKMNGKNQEDEYLLHFAHPDVVLRILLYPIQYKSLRNPEEVNHQNVESTNGWITLLCSQSPSTPLFQHYLGEVHGQETPQVSVDLHTAIYGVLSSGLCEKSPSAKDMARALSDCYLGEEDYADASRCLHSIIYVQDYTTIKDTLRSIIATKPHPKSQIVDVYEDVAHTVVLMSWRGGQDGLAKAMSLLADMGDDVACVALKDIRTPQVASDIDKMSKVIDRYASLCKTSLITSWHGRLVKARASEQNIVHALCAPESGKAR